MNDFISREDTIDKMQEVDWYHQNKNGEMVHGANSSEHQAWYKAEDVYKVLEDMPPADVQLDTKELVAKIKKGISATNADDVYSCGMRDGMRWCMSLVDDEEPLFENCPSAQPEREKGKWTKDCACEICGFKPWYERDIHTLSFCPNCGADMR